MSGTFMISSYVRKENIVTDTGPALPKEAEAKA
jgi:hypothetical protein